jgi:hypothetical protein
VIDRADDLRTREDTKSRVLELDVAGKALSFRAPIRDPTLLEFLV